jgi:S1-C subfamily serine protease
LVAAVLLVGAFTWFAPSAQAQSVGEVFRRVNSSVVVVRAWGRDVSAAPAGGLVRFNEIGSGVIISTAGQVITAAHVVNAMDEITVEAVGGEAVTARVVSVEPAADVALLQLAALPAGAAPARLAHSGAVGVGDQVLVIGAPYGLAHSLSVGWISARWAPNTVYRAMPLAEFFQTTATISGRRYHSLGRGCAGGARERPRPDPGHPHPEAAGCPLHHADPAGRPDSRADGSDALRMPVTAS